AIIRENPQIAGDLRRRMRMLNLYHRLGREGGGSASGAPRLRCPHCGHSNQLLSRETREMLCSGCGRSFRIEAPPALPGPPHAPERIGRFEVLGLLGSGSFGAVYRARDPELARVVAVKVPRSGRFASAE